MSAPRTMPARPPLRYHGGKWRLAPWVQRHFPAHRVYVEPFGGGAGVLLRKGISYAEVYNDLDADVVAFFRVLRDRPDDLVRVATATPFARAEWEAAYVPAQDDLERARRLLVRSHLGFGSAGSNVTHRTGFRGNVTRSRTTPAHDWARLPEHLVAVAERLRGVVVEHDAAERVIARYDGMETLHYCDPPYPHATRALLPEAVMGAVYAHEMDDDAHRGLAAALRGARGYVVLSGYPCALYDEELYPDWERVALDSWGSGQGGAVRRTEVLWLNPACSAALRRERVQLSLLEAAHA